ncbi:MAG: hypothetical protein J0H68_03435 [Sphingobacteriia bacterium]|nr:hypothetical protein [Sphingobacteriia bacterium]
MIRLRKTDYLLISFPIILLLILFFIGQIPQPHGYNNFADKREFFNIPFFLNVISNLTFIIPGAYWFYYFNKYKKFTYEKFASKAEFSAYSFFFIFLVFTGIGSAYYHTHPNNQSLYFDRLPETLTLMALTYAIYLERVSYKLGDKLIVVVILATITCVAWWELSEAHNSSDLRPIIFIQAFPILVPIMLWFYPNKFNETSYLILSLILFVFARIGEVYDKEIFALTDHFISGHSLKHIFGGIAGAFIGFYLNKRELINRLG